MLFYKWRNFLLLILAFVFFVSCGSNNKTPSNTSGNKDVKVASADKNTAEATKDKDSKPNEEDDIFADSPTKPSENKPVAANTATEVANTKDKNAKAKEDDVFADKNASSVEAPDNALFVDKKYKIVSDNYIGKRIIPKEVNPKEDEINNSVFLITTVSKRMTANEYYQKVLPDFEVVGFSLFWYSDKFSAETLRKFAYTISSNTVIVKRIYNTEKGKYFYDILFLKGNMKDPHVYWNFNLSTIAIATKIIGTGNKDNVVATDGSTATNTTDKPKVATVVNNGTVTPTQEVNNYETQIKLKYLKSMQEEQDKKYEKDLNEAKKEIAAKKAKDEAKGKDEQYIPDDMDKAKDQSNGLPIKPAPLTVDDVILPQSIKDDISNRRDQAIITERLKTITGSWVDFYGKTKVDIVEVPIDMVRDELKVNETAVEYKEGTEKYYAGFVDLNNSEAKKINKNAKINVGSKFTWHRNDLVFIFNASNYKGIFVGKDKMPQLASFRVFPAKGSIMVILPNGGNEYYIPNKITISKAYFDDLYGNIPDKQKLLDDDQEKVLTGAPIMSSLKMMWTIPMIATMLLSVMSF